MGIAAGSALLAILMLGIGATPALAQGEIGNFCAGDFVNPANCTANDVLLEAFFVQTVIEDCAEGAPFEAEVVFEALVTNNSPNRYGIGVFVALDGGSAVTGDMCLHDYLAPFSGNPDDWVLNGNVYSEPFPNLNGDLCGDIPGSFGAQKQLQQVRIACNDADGDGFVDIHACSSWENNAQAECNGLQDAAPGTPAKCGCETVATTIPLPAAVTIVKETTQGDGSFEFNSDLPGGGFTITTIGGTGQQGPIAVNPGSHTISEVVPDGWVLDSATCDNGDSPNSLSVAPGDEVTCTFVNSPVQPEPGSITIVKQSGNDDGTFSYSGDLGGFDITTSGGSGDEIFSKLDAGTYDVTETVPKGWNLDSIVCSDGSPTDVGSGTASIDLAKGEDVTCTFTNSIVKPNLGSITIVKQSGKNDGTFLYSGDLGGFNIKTSGGSGDQFLGDLAAGTYEVAESVMDGWTIVGIQCSDGSATNVGAGTASIDLAEGEDVTCTFTNRLVPPAPGTITIVKVSLGKDRVFNYSGGLGAFSVTTSDGSGSHIVQDLDAGMYPVTETVPKGWKLDSVECSDDSATDVASATAEIELAKGEGVVCTFTNSVVEAQQPNGLITIVKQTSGGNGTSEFSGALGPFEIITAEGSGTKTYGQLAAGTYVISEKPRKGWKLSSIACSNDGSTTDLANATATIVLAEDEQVACTFVNQVVQVVPTLPWAASISLMMLLASAAAWTLRRTHG